MIIGEETGGANDGTVAGIYSTQKLPNSKLKLPIGLFLREGLKLATEVARKARPLVAKGATSTLR
jgi:hypothetical protein